MQINSHTGLDLCFKLINGSLIWYTSFTNEIFGQRLSNYSCYAANLNMKAVSFFYSSCMYRVSKKTAKAFHVEIGRERIAELDNSCVYS